MPSGVRRLALPLVLSLGLHALVFAALFLLPSREVHSPLQTTGGSCPSLCIQLCSLEGPRPRPRPVAPLAFEWEHGTEPQLEPLGPSVDANVVLPVPGTSPGRGGGNEASSAGGSAEGPGKGTNSSHRLLEVPGEAHRIVYVIDRSVSMGPTGALARARAELLASLQRLPLNARFQIIFYNRHASQFSHDWLASNEINHRDVERRLAEFAPEGSTDHVAAMQKALLLRPDLVFLITDADELTPIGVQAITRLNVSQATIHVVELAAGSRDLGDNLLARLARSNGGTHRRVAPEF